MHRHELPVQIVAPNQLAGRIRFTNSRFCLVGAGSGVTLFDRLSVRATGIRNHYKKIRGANSSLSMTADRRPYFSLRR
jgi:hypothetical protein